MKPSKVQYGDNHSVVTKHICAYVKVYIYIYIYMYIIYIHLPIIDSFWFLSPIVGVW